MSSPFDRPLSDVARALREGETSARALLEEARLRYDRQTPALDAYCWIDPAAEAAAEEADRRLEGAGAAPGPLCGIPISVKDLYGVEGQPIWAGTARPLPDRWATEGWLVSTLRAQGAVIVGRTTTVELAYGAVGTNPHHGTPRNPHDDRVHRIPGGSSCGAGVSLVEGSALVALGTDTGGSIRIPASLTGTVGFKTTAGRWPTDGVVPLSHTLDTVGALTRSVADAAWFFDAVDPAGVDRPARLSHTADSPPIRLARPSATLLGGTAPSIADTVDATLRGLEAAGVATLAEIDGSLLDRAEQLYMEGCIVAAECSRFIAAELPEWIDLLDPRVAARLRGAPALDSDRYQSDLARLAELRRGTPDLFRDADLLVWPTHLDLPAAVSDLTTIDRYLAVNRRLLSSTCTVNALGLCALTVPVGVDALGLPVGLHLVGPAGADEQLLEMALRIESATP